MDVETAEAVDTLRTDIRRVEATLTGEITRVEATLTGEIMRVETTLSSEIVRVETTLSSEIVRVETSLTAKMLELNEDAKRHTDVRIEDVRDDIRILAEGFATLSAQINSRRE
jgi:hypothetical protein